MSNHSRSTDQTPYYVLFQHPNKLFEIDYPEHWVVDIDKDGTVQFAYPDFSRGVGIIFFRTPVQFDTSIIKESGKWEQIATAMMAQVDSTSLRPDPTILYPNYTADRPESDQAGQRWFVLAADIILAISTSLPENEAEQMRPVFERMLSSLRVKREDIHLAVKIMQATDEKLKELLPEVSFRIDNLKFVSDRFEVSVGNLFTQVKNRPDQLTLLVTEFVEGIRSSVRSEEPLGDETWASVSKRILPLIKSDKYVQDVNEMMRLKRDGDNKAALVSAPWLADLHICYALDDNRSFRFVNKNDIDRWEVDPETLHNLSIENLSQLPKPDLLVSPDLAGIPKIGVLQPSSGSASAYLLHPQMYEFVAEQIGLKLLAAIPSRDVLMLFADVGQLQELLPLVHKDFSTSDHPISDRVFQLTPDGVALV